MNLKIFFLMEVNELLKNNFNARKHYKLYFNSLQFQLT